MIQSLINLLKKWSQKFIHVTNTTIIIPKPIVPMSNAQKLINLCTDSLGTDVSPLNLAPQELSCAEGVSTLLSDIFTFPKGVLSTAQLKVCLDNCKYVERTLIPEPGCVIVSPTQNTTHGHTGIFLDSQNIASNDSRTGKFEKNYTLNSWAKEMRDTRGLRLYLWKVL